MLLALAEGSIPAVAKLRKTWDTEIAKLHEERDGILSKLRNQLGSSLDALVVELTRADRIEDANFVKAHRERLSDNSPAPRPETTAEGNAPMDADLGTTRSYGAPPRSAPGTTDGKPGW